MRFHWNQEQMDGGGNSDDTDEEMGELCDMDDNSSYTVKLPCYPFRPN